MRLIAIILLTLFLQAPASAETYLIFLKGQERHSETYVQKQPPVAGRDMPAGAEAYLYDGKHPKYEYVRGAGEGQAALWSKPPIDAQPAPEAPRGLEGKKVSTIPDPIQFRLDCANDAAIIGKHLSAVALLSLIADDAPRKAAWARLKRFTLNDIVGLQNGNTSIARVELHAATNLVPVVDP